MTIAVYFMRLNMNSCSILCSILNSNWIGFVNYIIFGRSEPIYIAFPAFEILVSSDEISRRFN